MTHAVEDNSPAIEMVIIPPFVLIEPAGKKQFINLAQLVDLVETESHLVLRMTCGEPIRIPTKNKAALAVLDAVRKGLLNPPGNPGEKLQVVVAAAEAAPPAANQSAPHPVVQDISKSAPPPPAPVSMESLVTEIISRKWIDYSGRDGYFKVCSMNAGQLEEYRVERIEHGTLISYSCDCFKFIAGTKKDPAFECEHTKAVMRYVEIHPEFAKAAPVAAAARPLDPSIERLTTRWKCHPNLQGRIEQLIEKILNHPARSEKVTYDSIIKQIIFKTNDRTAPQGMSGEAAERVEKWLAGWLTNGLDKQINHAA